MIKRALISVFDKTGMIPFAKGLVDIGFELISTGGTKHALEEAGLPVVSVSEITEFPEMLDGRVKTLHPKIHGGLLAIRDNESHIRDMQTNGIAPIDLVVCNLYPFKETIAKPGATFADAIENIDIGGPSMIRSAAKNHAFVTVVTDPADYEAVLNELKTLGETSLSLRQKLAAKAFRLSAAYDALIADYLTKQTGERFPERLTKTFDLHQALRYGENPHQEAAFYRDVFVETGTLAASEQLHGKALSFNNIRDADSALKIIKELDKPAVCAVKHMNPCGVGLGETVEEAYIKAYEADPVSIFGGIIAANRPIDEATARRMSELFLEIIIAPAFSKEALAILTRKKNIRLLTVPMEENVCRRHSLTSVAGGLLIQDEDALCFGDAELTYPTKRRPTEAEMRDLILAWQVVKHVKSNAIVLAKEDRTVGIGAGQMNRVGSVRIAVEQAGDEARGAVMASDAFFPMPDSVEEAAKAGITAIIQPGGSIRDQDSIEKADQYGIAMVFTGIRHFKH
ncbi:bifunctional phosphoribosylaminoimidazolecarboxamide formyltransferase/IMP cyclohydrolase [Tuberibacillus calidus]|uniref:bifunctional phosphoribosylaminoimidazolecarboxamide formyltransferase/IMP cyclohydrolase n=1 Tax=Tuberibacillus calidus TaxID=340097 RepID=UPI00041C00B4|nr:bifunctional phosphoribosylaminoimidazolecarboxamide formyltransferase/IMP cyclohydrolase [Tuberibacillus calidus]